MCLLKLLGSYICEVASIEDTGQLSSNLLFTKDPVIENSLLFFSLLLP